MVIAAAAAGTRAAINYFQSPEQEIARMSDIELVERLEREVIADSDFAPTFVRMKHDFPEEYADLMRRMTQLVRESASEDDAYIAGREFMAEFFSARRGIMRQGSEESLASFLDSQLRLLTAVGASDAGVCAQIIDTGRFDPDSGMALLPTTSAALNAANISMFDAILTGRTRPVERQPLTDAEWVALFERAEALGADMTVLSAMGGVEFSQFACGTPLPSSNSPVSSDE